jgi:gas vesicle protein
MPRFFPKSPTAILLIGVTAGAIIGACVAMFGETKAGIAYAGP